MIANSKVFTDRGVQHQMRCMKLVIKSKEIKGTFIETYCVDISIRNQYFINCQIWIENARLSLFCSIIRITLYDNYTIVILEYRLNKRKDFCYNKFSEYNDRNVFKLCLRIDTTC